MKRITCVWIAFLTLFVGLTRRFPLFAAFCRVHVTRPLTSLLGGLSARLPFPIAGGLAAVVCAAALALLRLSLRSRRAARRLAGLLCALLTGYVLLWDVLYACPAASAGPLPAPALAALCERLIHEAEEALPDLAATDVGAVLAESLALMRRQTGLTLSPPKPVLFPGLLTALGVAGFYSPLTGEALVNPQDLPDTLPFTACHELAHQAGWAREEEASFRAFLACEAADSALFRYSARFTLLLYAMEELRDADKLRWETCTARMGSALYARFQRANGLTTAPPDRIRAAQQAVTDAFLRLSGEQSGISSYRNVVPLVAAHWNLSDAAPGPAFSQDPFERIEGTADAA